MKENEKEKEKYVRCKIIHGHHTRSNRIRRICEIAPCCRRGRRAKDTGAETIFGTIGNLDRIRHVCCSHQNTHGTKQLFLRDAHRGRDVHE